MESLIIKPTEFTPGISFNSDTSIFEIYGFSRPENVVGFYKPIVRWLDSYEDNVLNNNTNFDRSNLVLNLKMTYFNSASSKFLLDILLVFMRFHSKGNNVVINWYYDEDDDEIRESGEELAEMIGFQFSYIEVKV